MGNLHVVKHLLILAIACFLNWLITAAWTGLFSYRISTAQTEFKRELLTVGRALSTAIKNNPCRHPGLDVTGSWNRNLQERADKIKLDAQDYPAFTQPLEIFKQISSDIKIHYIANTTGIVTTYGPESDSTFAVSFRMLRLTGCTLPVEVVLHRRHQNRYLCDVLLPPLNARCVSMDPVIRVEDIMSRFQYKVWAMIAASFENVLFLDADAFPVVNPTDFFRQAPYSTHGLVLFRDFWYPTASRHFFNMFNLEIPSSQDLWSTESGIVFISKRRHEKTLKTCAYINMNGPDLWYALLSQGSNGQGDKETFAAAALIEGLSFFQAKSPVQAIGFKGSREFLGVAMAHPSPFSQKGQETKNEDVAFIHCQYKLRLGNTMTNGDFLRAWTYTTDKATGKYRKLWESQKSRDRHIIEHVQPRLWREAEDILCGSWQAMLKLSPEAQVRQCTMLQDYNKAVFA